MAAGLGLEPRYHPPEGCVLLHPPKFSGKAAGLGLEPRYHPPEGCVLPLDDPAALPKKCEKFRWAS